MYQDMEYLCTEGELDYYLLSEVGFSNKKYASQHKLYEMFGKSTSSTYSEIFHKNLYDNNLIEQIWIFDKDKPVGLCMGIHFENFKTLTHQDKNLGEILGQIHLYVKPEYRGMGIAKKSTQLLEEGFLKYEQGFIVMQDNAMHCKKAISQLVAIPSDYKNHMDTIAKDVAQHKISEMRRHSIKSSLEI